MRALNFTLSNSQDLIILPDSEAHADGHAVLTYTYNIFLSAVANDGKLRSNVHVEKKSSPFYMGYIAFEQPDRVFAYYPDGGIDLEKDQVFELVKYITQYRNSPSLWLI